MEFMEYMKCRTRKGRNKDEERRKRRGEELREEKQQQEDEEKGVKHGGGRKIKSEYGRVRIELAG
jgi:hypothetical protein